MKRLIFILIIIVFMNILHAQTDISGLSFGMKIEDARKILVDMDAELKMETENDISYYGNLYGLPVTIRLFVGSDKLLHRWSYSILTEGDYDQDSYIIGQFVDFHAIDTIYDEWLDCEVIELPNNNAVFIYYDLMGYLLLEYDSDL
ncbi:MAG: hypothetical protein PHN71_07905 [Candidatus Cloacimonetes bacterium]|nr:hypothetical protein [Candidatus Cloacimonadota bacterium]MDY0299884.1 hypothetical protein [Candidatus Cloacimonadaceae bacterium]